MATAAANIATLDQYFSTGGDLGPAVNVGDHVERAMRELIHDASYLKPARAAFARASIFERTLNPPSIMRSTFVRSTVQEIMLRGIYNSATGGYWGAASPSGITEWLGSEAGGQHYFFTALNDPPRIINGKPLIRPPEILATMLKILRDVAIPASWLAPLINERVFEKLEVRVSESPWDMAMRRVLLALIGQAKGRVSGELARLATLHLDAFPTGEILPSGQPATAPTIPPSPKPWYRNGWAMVAASVGAIGGGALAIRR